LALLLLLLLLAVVVMGLLLPGPVLVVRFGVVVDAARRCRLLSGVLRARSSGLPKMLLLLLLLWWLVLRPVLFGMLYTIMARAVVDT
jgi:hypothetical protein